PPRLHPSYRRLQCRRAWRCAEQLSARHTRVLRLGPFHRRAPRARRGERGAWGLGQHRRGSSSWTFHGGAAFFAALRRAAPSRDFLLLLRRERFGRQLELGRLGMSVDLSERPYSLAQIGGLVATPAPDHDHPSER